MTVKARSTLESQATQIRDETSTAANTATRVGTMFLDFVQSAVLKSEEFTRVETIAVVNVASLSGAQTVNGISLVDGDPVLLTAQTTSTEDGPWIVKTGAWERPPGMTILKPGAVFYVERGTIHADTRWYLTNDTDVTLDTGSPTFSQGETLTFTHDAIGTADDTAILLQNTTPATAGAQVQNTPTLKFKGTLWDTTPGQSRAYTWRIQGSGAGGSNVSASLAFALDVDGGGFTNALILADLLGSGNPSFAFQPSFGAGTGTSGYVAVDTPTTDRNGMGLTLLAGAAGGTNRNGGDWIGRPGDKTGAGTKGIGKLQSADSTDVLSWGGSSGAETFGAFGVALTTRPTAYTQTYSTATKTHANPTAAALTDSTTGTATQTINDVGASFSQSTLNDNFASLTDEVEKNRADILNVKQVLNAVIDDDQALGWKQ